MSRKWTQLWLSYDVRNDCGNASLVGLAAIEGFSMQNAVVMNAWKEWQKGISGMLGVVPRQVQVQELHTGLLIRRSRDGLRPGGYRITGGAADVHCGADDKNNGLLLEALDESGLLYGIFHLLRCVAMEKFLGAVNECCNPDNPLRMLNHWDNMDGSIERGYSGESFFFEDGNVVVNERTVDYARLAASTGINGVVINNVNVKEEATWLITDRYLGKLEKMAEIFRGYGISLFLSLNYAAPMELGGPDSADPLSEEVREWWRKRFETVFAAIPDLGGFLVKADSEGRPGPFTYGRTQADGANMLADLVKPYGAVIIWRCFVYNCTQDWRDYKTDRAKAGYDAFIETDGDYHDNVILQIKNGPMDFQIREPVSPLLGGLRRTNQILEVQIAQEYTGQQIDLCYLVPMFKEVLEFRTYCCSDRDTVADIVSGRTFPKGNVGEEEYPGRCGMAAVCNTGNDENWTGNDLAAANLYGFGRLSFNTDLSAEEIAREWVRMTYSNNRRVVEVVTELLLGSRETYEKYTSPLGIGWMVVPDIHYGPAVDGYEYSRWGTYHRADHWGIGVDRTDSGTGYVRQYHEPNASRYNSLEECPEELLLFFHHVPYTHVLHSGKTLIQHIYDTHFEGVEEVEKMIRLWESLEGEISQESYRRVRQRFARQLVNAREWRDQVNSYFYRKSGIMDEKKRPVW